MGGILLINQISGVATVTEIAIGSKNPVKIQSVKNALNDVLVTLAVHYRACERNPFRMRNFTRSHL